VELAWGRLGVAWESLGTKRCREMPPDAEAAAARRGIPPSVDGVELGLRRQCWGVAQRGLLRTRLAGSHVIRGRARAGQHGQAGSGRLQPRGEGLSSLKIGISMVGAVRADRPCRAGWARSWARSWAPELVRGGWAYRAGKKRRRDGPRRAATPPLPALYRVHRATSTWTDGRARLRARTHGAGPGPVERRERVEDNGV
jgi:hypothetical protein